LAYILSPFTFLFFKVDTGKTPGGKEAKSLWRRLSNLAESLFAGPQPLVELDSIVHLCSDLAGLSIFNKNIYSNNS
jgi:hypothetical protein